jgi:hypothetical protein
MGVSIFSWKRIKALQRLDAMSPAPRRRADAAGGNLLKVERFAHRAPPGAEGQAQSSKRLKPIFSAQLILDTPIGYKE